MAVLSKVTPEQIADKFAIELDSLCKKYRCSVGVWLTWRDLESNLDKMRKTPGFDEAEFGLQIRFKDVESKN
jgi:hypothetical protein